MTMTAEKMTPWELCRQIDWTMAYVTDTEKADIQRTYALTWGLVHLTLQGYAMPTEKSRNRLLDLLDAVEAVRTRWLAASTAQFKS